MIENNKTYEAMVTDLTVNGDGIAKTEGFPLFVKGAVPGDKVLLKTAKLNKTYGFAKMIKLLSPSDKRRTPPCKSFGRCGGCTLMHMDYKSQLEFKQSLVLSNIRKIGGYKIDDFIFEGIIGDDSEFYYRNKAQFPVRSAGSKAVCGFYEQKSHNVISCRDCFIQDEVINKAVNLVMEYVREFKIIPYNEINHKGTLRHIYVRYSAENMSLMVVLVTNTKKILKNTDILADKLKPLGLKSLIQNINTEKTNVILGEKNITLWGDDHILIKTDDLIFKVSPHSFFQVNTKQMKKLYKKALDYAGLKGSETVFDLYCGVGSISLYMAKKANKVIGVEIVPQAIENAVENSALSCIENAEFYCGDCTEVVDKLIADGESADVVVVDPPRKGCDQKLLELINNISPEKLVYVSCNSATLARDIAILNDFGYKLKKCCAVDLFPQSGHIETVALLTNEKTINL